MQASIFWLSGVAFFAVQLAILLALLGGRRATRAGRGQPVEIVWTLVPAVLLAALVLMMGGFTVPSWSRVRSGVELVAVRRTERLQPLLAAPIAAAERR